MSGKTRRRATDDTERETVAVKPAESLSDVQKLEMRWLAMECDILKKVLGSLAGAQHRKQAG